MNFFRRADYKSEVTQFIDTLKVAKPTLEAEQRHGRELLWDKAVDRAAWKEYREAEVAQKPYVYQTDARGEYVPGGTGASGSDRPRLFGYLRSDARGEYSFSTIRPGSYPNSRNPGHIHFEVVADGHQPRIYEIVFEGDSLIPATFREQARSPYGGVAIVTIRAGKDVTHDVLLRAR